MPDLSSTEACTVINSTSAKEQINGGSTVMECLVKGDGIGEQRDRKQAQKDLNVDQKRPESGKEMWKKYKNERIKIHLLNFRGKTPE